MRTVICSYAWPFANGTPLVKDKKYQVVREFWRNGEGHYIVKDIKTGAKTEAPDVFFGAYRE